MKPSESPVEPPAPTADPGACMPDGRALRTGRPETHGLTTLKSAVRRLGVRTVDRRTTLGKQLVAWRAAIIEDLGGNPSTAQRAVVDLAMRTKLMLDSIDAWLLSQPSLVDKRKRALLPVVKERQQLADSLARHLGQLGLERRAAPRDWEQSELARYLANHCPSGSASSQP